MLRDEITAAEGVKAMLDRRAAQFGVAMRELRDEDDWGIGFVVGECKATSEPLHKPKTCSICLRCAAALVWRRHPSCCQLQHENTRLVACTTCGEAVAVAALVCHANKLFAR